MTIDAARLHTLTLTEVLAVFRTGDLTPTTYMEACIARIHALDPTYNAVMDIMEEPARQAAAAATEAYRRSSTSAPSAGASAGDLPPLLGIPLLVKEQHDVAGCSATRGSRARAGQVAAADHPFVARLRAAGAIPFARTTTPESSCATFTQTEEWGTSRNPFNLKRTPGGSSGGSGAAVALGYAPLATASDIAGSTRIPAAFCGLPGFKTPFGRTPAVPPLNQDWYRGDHILARTVADTAFATGISYGIHPADHATIPTPQPYLADPEVFSGDLTGLRVGVSPDLGCYAVDPEVAAGLQRAAEALAAAGAEVVEADVALSLEEITAASMSHYGHFIAGNIRRMCDGRIDLLEPYTQLFLQLTEQWAQRIPVIESLVLENRIQTTLATALDAVDVLLTPTSAVASLAADDHHLDGLDGCEFYWQRHMTVPFNIANRLPVMAMPTGVADGSHGGSAHGVPTSVQIVGRAYDDETVFRVAAALESRLPAPVAPAMQD